MHAQYHLFGHAITLCYEGGKRPPCRESCKSVALALQHIATTSDFTANLNPHSLEAAPGRLVFNRTITLKDTWAKVEKKNA